ncbi:MAG: DUF1585 domain-containing protein [Proteobacteria bacterium]|nr:MAG: DUF1585 domain-containing protein [Pseudomonadota bacterium]
MKIKIALCFLVTLFGTSLFAGEDLPSALRRSKYLLTGSMPTDGEFSSSAASKDTYKAAVRSFVDDDHFYDAVLRYHERVLGVGLPEDYMEELMRDDIDGKQEKFASITCGRFEESQGRFNCTWTSNVQNKKGTGCPQAWERPVSVFWYPKIVAWVCPSVVNACGQDLSKCFIKSLEEDEARNSEIGTTEAFDSRFAVMRSLSRQAAGLATAVAIENYPYTKILEPGLTAVDGAISHFYSQSHHFKISELDLDPEIKTIVAKSPLTDTRYKLLKTTAGDPNTAGIISTFGWLRRYDKNRTRGNELYKRLLCRDFVSDLPRVFPQDPGNLRETEGCKGCHSTLDPLADFFKAWGEGADLYSGRQALVSTEFANVKGATLADLGNIVRKDEAFATCTVQNVWYWLMGRKFYTDEENLRTAFTEYFETSNYSFRELVYAIATHPAFLEGTRSAGLVADALTAPPLGKVPEAAKTTCDPAKTYTYAADVAPLQTQCTGCHTASSTTRQALVTENDWNQYASLAVTMMGSGSMPPGPTNSKVQQLRTAVQCWKGIP